MSGPATGGYIAGNIIVVVFVLIGLGFIIAGLLYGVRDGGWIGVVSGIVWFLISVGVWAFATWPFAYEYHHWIPKHVTVASDVQSRFLTDSDGNINQKFVVRDTHGTYYGINDTRASLIKEGATVDLRCKKAYDFGVPRSAHGWDCKWAGVMK